MSCIGSTCVDYQCKLNGQSCSYPGDCCSGLCKGYICSPPLNCRKMDETCGSTGECCGGVCLNYVCKTPPECKAIGEWCFANSECCTKKCKINECSEYVAMTVVGIRGNQSFEQGKGGVFTAFGKYETGEEENVSVMWALDGDIGKLRPADGTNATLGTNFTLGTKVLFEAKKVGGGVIRIVYNDGVKTIATSVPVTVMPGPAVRIEIFYSQGIVNYGEKVIFTARGYDKDGNAVALNPSEIAWSADGGYIDQLGAFIAPKEAGNFTVTATYESYKTTATVEVITDPQSTADSGLFDRIMAQVYTLLGQLVLAIIGGLLLIIFFIYALKALLRAMEKSFSLPQVPAGSSVLIEGPPESKTEKNVYEILNRAIGNRGNVLVLTLKAEETVPLFKRNIRNMDNVKIAEVEQDFTKVGIKLSELLEQETFAAVYFSFFGKMALAQGADVSSEFIGFNMIKLNKAKTIGIFRVELNEKLTSEFLSKLEMEADIVVEHKVVDKEYAMIKQWKGTEFEKRWIRFK